MEETRSLRTYGARTKIHKVKQSERAARMNEKVLKVEFIGVIEQLQEMIHHWTTSKRHSNTNSTWGSHEKTDLHPSSWLGRRLTIKLLRPNAIEPKLHSPLPKNPEKPVDLNQGTTWHHNITASPWIIPTINSRVEHHLTEDGNDATESR